jgi:kynurenine formamidase
VTSTIAEADAGQREHLETVPSHGCTVACFSMKIRAASAGWTRAVAILDA